MKKQLAGLIAVCITLFSAVTGSAAVLFGPNAYIRTTGDRDVFSEAFDAVPGEYYLIVKNGNADGTHRVSSAHIRINDALILDAADFNQNEYILKASIQLLAENTLFIELSSAPGSFLTVEIKDACQLIFSPDPYLRTKGKPDVYTESFIATSGDGFLTVENGQEDGRNRVTSATISINHEVIFEANDFKTDDFILGAEINLAADNTVTVELSSKPGSYLRLEICQEPPTVNLTVAPDTIIEGQTAELSWETDFALTASIDNGIGDVELNGSLLVSPTETTTYTITAFNVAASFSDSLTLTIIPVPRVTLTATPETISYGNSAELSWTSEHADRVIIDNGIGEVESSGILSVFPLEDTIYTITAAGPGGTAKASVKVVVINPPPTVTITAEPQVIDAGESFTLAWTTEHADLVIGEKTSADGTVSQEIPLSGTSILTPEKTTTYTIIATGPGGTTTESIIVEVIWPAPTVSISANPAEIYPGGSTALSWSSGYAESCNISPSVGDVEFEGTTQVAPSETITYTITGTGPGGTATDQVTVNVASPLPVVNFSADPETINPGGSSTLSWQVFMADICEITPDIGPVDFISAISVTPTETTTYTLTATGPGGTVTKSVTIRIPDVDLAPTAVDATGSITNGQTLEISGTVDVDITNNGTRPVNDAFSATLFEDIDNNSGFDAGIDNLLGSQTLPSGPAPGETMSLSIPVDGVMTFADNRIFAFADSENNIFEDDETNNIKHSMSDCEYHPPVGNFNPVVEWEWTGSQPFPSGNEVDCPPKVINLNDDNGDGLVNNDDIPDIVFIAYPGNRLHAISGDGSGALFSVPNFMAYIYSGPAVGDIDGDGLPEIIAMDRDGLKIAVFENDGSLKWFSDSLDTLYWRDVYDKYPRISIADVDQDGSPDIIYCDHVLNADGTIKWIGGAGYGMGAPCIADIDLDGSPEIVTGNTVYRSNGDVYWTNPEVYERVFTGIGNFDDDPFPEIVAVGQLGLSGYGYVRLLEHTGQIIWSTKMSHTSGGSPCIADFDNDGEPEIGASCKLYYTVFEGDGSIKWENRIQDTSSGFVGSSVFDFEGDGSAEVVFMDEQYFRIYRGTDGAVLYELPNTSHTALEYPVIADVDNDNNAEIILPANISDRGLRIIGSADGSWVNTQKIWNQHAYHITNINDDGTIPRFEANNWETFNNYRQNEMLNPFGCTDLSASMIRVDRTQMPEAARLIVRVGNGGVLHVNSGVNVSFYNGDPETGGILLGTVQTTDRIYPGRYEDVGFSWENPAIDIYTIHVRVDDDGTGFSKIAESRETNNEAITNINLGNQAPIADAGPDRTVFINELTIIDGSSSSDPENNPLTHAWELISKPAGSSAVLINPYTVNPSLTPDLAGEYVIQLQVNDGLMDSGINTATITACPPVIVPDVAGLILDSAAIAIGNTGLVVGAISDSYSDTVPLGHVMNQSPAGGTVTYLNAPVDITLSLGVQTVMVPDVTGMTLEEAGTALAVVTLSVGETTGEYIDIQPVGHVFDQSVAPGAQIPHGSAIDLKLSLGVWTGPDETPPYVWVTADPTEVDITEPVFLTVIAADNVGVVATQLTVNGAPVSLINGQSVYVSQTPGYYTAHATATDAGGLTSTADVIFKAIDPNDIIPPVALLSETDCVEVTDLYDVAGDVYDISGVSYTLSFRYQGASGWKTLAAGSGESISGTLGTFDPTVLKNGVYEILLYAEDLAGNSSVDLGCILVDGQLKVGQVILPGGDVNIPNSGLPLALERQYDSRDVESDFGPGWNLPSSTVRPQTTRDLDAGWAEEVGGTFLTVYYLIETYRHEVVIRFSDEETLRFKIDVNPKSSVMIPIAGHTNLHAVFVPVDRTNGSLEALNVTNDHLMLIGDRLMEWGTDPYAPVRFKYTRPDGTQYILHLENGIESITDVYGNAVSYDDMGIHHSSGMSIEFTRGTGNRIETITDPFGMTIEYHYDANGMLEQVIKSGTEPFAVRMLNKYGYAQGIFEKPVLKDIKAPDGTILGQFEYDSAGRMTGLIDADGNKIIYGFDVPNHVQEITDRRGYTSVYEYDGKGYVTKKTDSEGNITQWTYDEFGNKLSETDPSGNTTSWTYDASGNMLSESDALGSTTTYTYNERNDILTQVDANGNETAYVYDALGNLLEKADAMGNVTSYTHDAKGNVLTETDSLGNVTTYEYNFYGHRTKEIAPGGKVTEWSFDGYGNELGESVTRTTETGTVVTMSTTNEYDIRNRLTRSVDPMGNETRTEYNFLDKESRVIDKNGAETLFEYDNNGNQTAIHYADGTSMLTEYDAEGNRTATTDRAGRTTWFEYDANNQMTVVIHPDGSSSEMVFDEAGWMIATIDENGNQTDFEYDNAGRRTAVTDALGNTVSFDYDAAGNQISMTDPKGATTYYEYDALNRQVRTVYPDGTYSGTGYDALGRKISETDQAGNTTYFEYDAAGNLVSVTDALGNITGYAYDEVGNRLSHTDPNGNSEFWTYDNLGRVVSHELPLGMAEAYTYDPMDNVLTHRDFNGDTVVYEYSPCCGRLTLKTYPDGSSVAYTYLGDGKRETVTGSRGITQYGYDDRGRLESVIDPEGSIISYTYDAKGNRTSVTVPSGTTNYTYDALNRLSTVTDPSGGVTSYTYDANGNRSQVENPNGTVAEYTYDALNRLTYLENRTSAGDIISSYFYTLGPAGNRQSVTENSGRQVNYTYDAVYRLTQEEIIDPPNGNETIAYTYDGKGNRLTKTDGSGTVAYSYDINDRLLTETGPGFVHSYGYDANGNTTVKSAAGDATAYVYDFENRLVGMETMASTVAYVYDADGIRTAHTVDATETSFIVDKNRNYAQVLEERDALGSLTVSFVYGDDLISQERGGVDSYYHYDGLGSTRVLTDDTESVTDIFDYEAFGTLIHSIGTTANSYLFCGEQYDPNAGFYYLRARYYNPGVGRFVTTDPYAGKTSDPKSLHKYMYANMNPVMFVDASGEISLIGVYASALVAQHIVQGTTSFINNVANWGEERFADVVMRRFDFTTLAYLFVPMHCYLEFQNGDTLTYDDDDPGVHVDRNTGTWVEYRHKIPLLGQCNRESISDNISLCDDRDYRFISNNCCDCLRIALADSGCQIPAGLRMVNFGF